MKPLRYKALPIVKEYVKTLLRREDKTYDLRRQKVTDMTFKLMKIEVGR